MQKRTKTYLLTLLALVTVFSVKAQEVSFTARTEKVVQLGEQFQLVYEISARPQSFGAPSLKAFNSNGPRQGSNSSTQIINGKVTQKSSYTFTYTMQAKTAGTFTLKPAISKVKGKEYKSNPVTIKVVGGNSDKAGGSGSEDIFLRIDLSKTKAYRGEQIVATLKLYTKHNIADLNGMSLPDYNGFFTEEIETENNINFERESYKNEIYQVGILKKTVLTPQKSGEIIISPFELGVVYQKQVRRRSFFDSGVQNVRVDVKSKARTIVVLPLPGSTPTEYSGGVGSYNIKTTLSSTTPKANEAITLKTVITGRGNLKLLAAPKFNFPADFEVYDPKIANNIKTDESGAHGSKTIDILLIPRFSGEYRIPEANFIFFNTKTGKYKTLKIPEFKLSVAKGDESENATYVSGTTGEAVKTMANDIRFIKLDNEPLKQKQAFLIEKGVFYVIYAGSSLLFLVILFVYRKKVRENANVNLVKTKRAGKISRKRLKKAAEYIKTNETDKFYTEILNALWLYISDKLTIPVAELTKESALEGLRAYFDNTEELKGFEQLADTCEFAKFAPGSVSETPKQIFDKASKTIELFEQRIK